MPGWENLTIVLWETNPDYPHVNPGKLSATVTAILARQATAPEVDPYRYRYLRLGDLTKALIQELREQYGLPPDRCPFCCWNSGYLMRVVDPRYDTRSTSYEGRPEHGGVTHRCLCIITRPPTNQDGEAQKLEAVRQAGFGGMPYEFVERIGLDYGWRPAAPKRKRLSFAEASEPLVIE